MPWPSPRHFFRRLLPRSSFLDLPLFLAGLTPCRAPGSIPTPTAGPFGPEFSLEPVTGGGPGNGAGRSGVFPLFPKIVAVVFAATIPLAALPEAALALPHGGVVSKGAATRGGDTGRLLVIKYDTILPVVMNNKH